MALHGDPSFLFKSITGVTGYLLGNKILRDMDQASGDSLDGMFLTLPDGVRDLQDASIERWEGQNWLRLSSYLYRPLSGVSLLAPGPASVAIGSDEFIQWRRLPSSGMLSVNGASYWFLYDADFKELASGTTSGTPSFSGVGAKYLALFGARGAAINLNLTAP